LFLNLITELSLNRREGVETEIQNGREEDRETPLHVAVRKRNNEKDLDENLRGFAKSPDINGMPPLYLAIFLGYSDMAEQLIETFGSDLSFDGPNGQNVLHVAALRSRGKDKRCMLHSVNISAAGRFT
jgi:ankyrin repeat protein